MDRVSERIQKSSDKHRIDNFHESMPANLDIFPNIIFATKD